eukprot:CAMPEP_0115327024 /NCGR_PEP_ID=MMETSP0270-20121206/83897_1 /TAXON_ID=71861 /ORGANISM="Scrippsiella trochoidea, Strain CCMP3099" /LENGTH=52 /DNA_ID=CAMNT_0002747393 /DNA_START=72 /DNA_END=227 /DNA_ORIENTATION=+
MAGTRTVRTRNVSKMMLHTSTNPNWFVAGRLPSNVVPPKLKAMIRPAAEIVP